MALRLLWCAFLCALAYRTWQYWAMPPFSPDSWSYYELARSVFTDFYRITTWRQFQFEAPYGVSFPPLWPIVVAIADAASGAGYRAGILANLVIACATAWALQRACARFCGLPALGLAIALALLAQRSYVAEVFAARAMPLAILLFVLLATQVHALARGPAPTGATARGIAFAAALTGLATLTRFDFLPAALLLGIAVPMFVVHAANVRARILLLAVWVAVFGLVLAPWAAYGIAHFDRAFVSDNSRTVLSAVRIYVDDFHPNALPTLLDSPVQWLEKTTRGALAVTREVAKSVLLNLALLGLLVVGLAWRRWPTRPAGNALFVATRGDVPRAWWVLDLAALGVLASVMLAGFASSRYALPLEAYLLLRVGVWACAAAPSVSALLAPLLALALQWTFALVPTTSPLWTPTSRAFDDGAYAHLAGCLRDAPGSRVFFLTEDNVHAYRFGALHAVGTLTTPHNYRTADLALLARRFGATHVFDELETPLDGGLAQRLGATLEPACGAPSVYRLRYE